MPAQWTGELIGEMHIRGVTAKQLAAEVGWNEKYLSVVLNGHKEPKGAEEKLKAALLRLEVKKEREEKGLSTDLYEVVKPYQKSDPEYAERLKRAMGIASVQGVK